MRMDIDHTDAQYPVIAEVDGERRVVFPYELNVTFNGKILQSVAAFDTEEGWVEVVILDEDFCPIEDPSNPRGFVTARLEGDVGVELGEDDCCPLCGCGGEEDEEDDE
jgi:bifunctional DNA-binding transcriptional regulator/antitoxin component of YhaV-PrlF toxin-antitoxin module